MAEDIGARKYLECSALSGDGVDKVFETATRVSLLGREGKRKKRQNPVCVAL